MTVIARLWGIPCRYVSGYLYHKGSRDRSAANATHAWVEAYLPSLGWVGFDPTNNIMAGQNPVPPPGGGGYVGAPPPPPPPKNTRASAKTPPRRPPTPPRPPPPTTSFSH